MPVGATSNMVMTRSGLCRRSATTVFQTSPLQTTVARSRVDVGASMGTTSWTRTTVPEWA